MTHSIDSSIRPNTPLNKLGGINKTRDRRLEEPILMGGCGSSGTTLLRLLINSHPSIHCGPELSLLNKRILYSKPFHEIGKNFEQYLENGIPTTALPHCSHLPWSTVHLRMKEMRFLQNVSENYSLTSDQLILMAQESASFKEFLNRFFGTVLANNGKLRWAEKTPTNCYCIGEFLSLYPKGKYVHLVRDGRDVVPSLMKRRWSAPTAVRRWMYDSATGLKYRNHPRYFELRYEDLVTNPSSSLKNLFKFLNEDYELETLLDPTKRPEDGDDIKSSWKAQPTDPISKASIKKWKQKDYEEKDTLQRLFQVTKFSKETTKLLGLEMSYFGNELLTLYGYDIYDDWQPKPPLSRLTFRHYLSENRPRRTPQKLPYFRIAFFESFAKPLNSIRRL